MQEQKPCIKKRITRGMVTGQNHTLQKCRFFWSSVKNSDNFSTKLHVWKQWLRTANSFNNKCNGRSYAQVVAQNLLSKSFGQNNQKTNPNKQLFPTALLPQIRKPNIVKVKGQKYIHTNPLTHKEVVPV